MLHTLYSIAIIVCLLLTALRRCLMPAGTTMWPTGSYTQPTGFFLQEKIAADNEFPRPQTPQTGTVDYDEALRL
jgi:hypothetical protein